LSGERGRQKLGVPALARVDFEDGERRFEAEKRERLERMTRLVPIGVAGLSVLSGNGGL
jgi:hypothetical protein